MILDDLSESLPAGYSSQMRGNRLLSRWAEQNMTINGPGCCISNTDTHRPDSFQQGRTIHYWKTVLFVASRNSLTEKRHDISVAS